MRLLLSRLIIILAMLSGAVAQAAQVGTSQGPVEITKMVEGLDTPWALAFLPGGGFLVTERDGKLLLVEGGQARNVAGLPDVHVSGQGGLLDVMVPGDFERSGEVVFTFSDRYSGGSGTAVAVARLDRGAARLEGVRVIFRQADPGRGGRHFGSRIVEAPDGSLFITLGDRGDRDNAQSLESHKGKVIRINRDGSIPAGNPFANTAGARPEIWSYGHRNPQSAALDAQSRLWTVEHGPRGGDEVNRPEPGKNYGWPVISYGVEYSGGKVGTGTSAPGMEQPLFYWDPSIAPSGLMIYSGRLWPEWRGHLFVGSLKFDFISRLSADGGGVAERERLFEGEYSRIRDIREAPDGSIWFISEIDGAIYRVVPG